MTGTVVLSLCSRCTNSTSVSTRRYSGMRANAVAPTLSASVETLSDTPSGAKLSACRLSGWCRPYFSNNSIARKLGAAPRQDMKRRRRMRDLLAVPACELLPHGLNDLQRSGDHLQRLGRVLAELREARAAAGRPRAWGDDALAR
jgi:hypothetical protein